MSTKQFSVHADAGNGGVNAVCGKADCYFPSVRSLATGDRLDIGTMQMDAVWYGWNGSKYYVGDDVVKMRAGSPERHQGANRYGNEQHQFLVAVACSKFGAGLKGKQAVDLSVFAPPGMYNEASARMKEEFMDGDGKVKLHIKDEAKPREWQYTSVNVWPEGVAAAAALMFDQNGIPKWQDQFNGNVLLLDGGVYTLDVILLQDGNLNPEMLQHATWAGEGLRKHIIDPILRDLRGRGGDFSVVTVDMVDAALRHPEHKLFISSANVVEIAPMVRVYGEKYAEWVANEIIDSQLRSLDGIDKMVTIGGWSDIVTSGFKKWYGDKVFDHTKHPFASKVHRAYLNAYGSRALEMALARQQS